VAVGQEPVQKRDKKTAGPVQVEQAPKGGKPWPNKAKEAFYTELSVMLAAGVDIKTALDLIAGKQGGRGRVQAAIRQIGDAIVSGLSLSEATSHTGGFTPYERYSIQIGEETGRVGVVLASLAEHYTKRIKLRRQLVQALSYPLVVLVTAFSAIVFMLRFIVPMFSEVFSRFGGKLPALTVFIIDASAFFRAYLPLLLLVLSFAGILIYLQKNTTWLRKASSSFLLALPVLGATARCVYMARLCEALSLLISARVPLVQAVGLVRKMAGFYPIEESLQEVERDLLAGKGLHESLSRFALYDSRLLALVRVGEEANKLDFFFNKLAGYYSDEVEHRSSVIGSMLEPVIIILLGAVVGVVLLAMYLPMFEMSANIQ